ncbi:MAG TPA: glycoside hydrolase family 43 protein [Vicinamibacterales bacterium]|nr:glycoside hydrolase family 43 protein [Vicinamibacterales bacterium]
MPILLSIALAAAAGPSASERVSWTNPLVEQRADPHLTLYEGQYLMTATVPEYDRIEIRRAPSLDALRDATPHVVWRRHGSGPMSWHIWAPELHRIDGRWYIYFAAGKAEDIWAIRMYVLENASEDPLTGTWVEKGQIKTKWDTFSLDATTFVHRGQRYLAWAQKDPAIEGNTNLYLAKMDTPWSITGEQVRLSKPDLPWERVKYMVNEGPAVLIRNGRVFMTYSASATNEYYCMGLLTADEDADLLDPKSWRKSQRPVFATWSVNGVYGPGHNSFTTTPDGKTDVMVYHARSYREIVGHELDNPDRHTRAQPISWRADGTPDFGVPVPDGLLVVGGRIGDAPGTDRGRIGDRPLPVR